MRAFLRSRTVFNSATIPPGRGDGEALSARGDDIVEHLFGGMGFDIIGNQYGEVVDGLRLFGVVWLIQSQSQAGTASAKAFEDNPQQFPGVFLQDHLQLFLCQISNGHACHPFVGFTPQGVNNAGFYMY